MASARFDCGMNGTGPDIVLVEDNPQEAQLIEEIFKEMEMPPRLHVYSGARAALAYLRGEEPGGPRTPPSLILLDLNMPDMDGREFLRIVKSDERLKQIPVVILSGSAEDADVQNAYRQSANGYVAKPSRWEDYREAVRGIAEFWLTTVTLPPS